MLRNRFVLVSGASRGIGRAIALKCAHDGAIVGLLGRSVNRPVHKSLRGTLEETADAVNRVGGVPHIMPVNLLDTEQVVDAVEQVVQTFGGIDAVVNNASAIYPYKYPTMKQVDLMIDINVRGTMNMIAACAPSLKTSDVGHILSISPPLHTAHTKWLRPHPLYTMSKYAMTMMTLGYSDEFRANTIWPRKLIKTAATQMIESQTGIPGYTQGLPPEYFAGAVHHMLCSEYTGQSILDEDLFAEPHVDGIDDIFID